MSYQQRRKNCETIFFVVGKTWRSLPPVTIYLEAPSLPWHRNGYIWIQIHHIPPRFMTQTTINYIARHTMLRDCIHQPLSSYKGYITEKQPQLIIAKKSRPNSQIIPSSASDHPMRWFVDMKIYVMKPVTGCVMGRMQTKACAFIHTKSAPDLNMAAIWQQVNLIFLDQPCLQARLAT